MNVTHMTRPYLPPHLLDDWLRLLHLLPLESVDEHHPLRETLEVSEAFGLLQFFGALRVALGLDVEAVANGFGGEVAEFGDVDDGDGVEGEDPLVF